MRIVAIKERSAGNDRVGEMWKETKVFDSEDALADVMDWVGSRQVNVTLTVPENDKKEYEQKLKDNRPF